MTGYCQMKEIHDWEVHNEGDTWLGVPNKVDKDR